MMELFLDIIEGTVAREDAPKTTNELGRSVTSKLKEDREKSGLASGILSEFEGHPIKVSLEGFTHDDLRELLANKDSILDSGLDILEWLQLPEFLAMLTLLNLICGGMKNDTPKT